MTAVTPPSSPEGQGSEAAQNDISLLDTEGSKLQQNPKQAVKYDPHALLSPGGGSKRLNDPKPADDESKPAAPVTTAVSMIEKLHNVGYREGTPPKRVKREHSASTETSGHGGTKNGVLGQYMKDKRQGEVSVPDVVDLTTVDDSKDDSEPVVVDEIRHEDEEVCIGRVNVFINAHLVPTPKTNAFAGNNTNIWPPMKLSLRLDPSQQRRITAIDPQGQSFGYLDPRSADALAPLMRSASSNKLRFQPRMMGRKKDGNPAGARISQSISAHINIYGLERGVGGLGRYLTQRQIVLQDPTFVDRGIRTSNPHASQIKNAMVHRGSSSQVAINGQPATYYTRTIEEVRMDVLGMFDSLPQHDNLHHSDQSQLIVTPLLPHQQQALTFLTERETGVSASDGHVLKDPMWRENPGSGMRFYNVITGVQSTVKPDPPRGGILADLMGLGKTLSILSLIVSTLEDAQKWSRKKPITPLGSAPKSCAKATLLICPTSTISNWEEQICAHIRPGGLNYYVYHGTSRSKRAEDISHFDLVITTYNIVSIEEGLDKPLTQLNWFRIVLDEAHMIRSQETRQSKAVCALSAHRRWAVTGTPVQNRLDDLGALIKFLRIKPLDDKNGFKKHIMAPFKDADPDILPRLRLLVDSLTLRRSKDHIDLPPRHDHIVKLAFSEEERPLYDWFERDSARRVTAITGGRGQGGLGGKSYAHILRAILRLRLLCAHGQELLSEDDMKLTEGLNANNAIDLGDEDDEQPVLSTKQAFDMLQLLQESDMDRCSECNKKVELQDEQEGVKIPEILGHMSPCYHLICPDCLEAYKQRCAPLVTTDKFLDCPLCGQYVRFAFFTLRQKDLEEDEEARAKLRADPRRAKQLGRYNGPHSKTRALLDNLAEDSKWSKEHPDEPPIKSVVFSGWTSHLDLIEFAFEDAEIEYTRLDGRMSRKQRTAALEIFRDKPSTTVMLISIGAGGLGLNLTTASKAYVMEPQFNPAAEAQAVDRVHRLGQKRAVTVTRFIMDKSFEEKMLELQRKKMKLADISMNRNIKLDKQDAARQRLQELRGLFR